MTYPDVILGALVNPGGAPAQALAAQSVQAFDLSMDPTLRAPLRPVCRRHLCERDLNPVPSGHFGSRQPLTLTHKTKKFGVIPNAVLELCQLTYFCPLLNIHANTRGDRFIGQLIVAALNPDS